MRNVGVIWSYSLHGKQIVFFFEKKKQKPGINLSLAAFTFPSIMWDELFNFHKDQKIKSKMTKQRISVKLLN